MNIKDFMLDNTTATQDVRLKRFNAPFKIKTITTEENEDLRKQALKPITKNGILLGHELDDLRYSRSLMVACVVEPDFTNAELCKFYGTLDPLEVPGKMLRAGEYNALARAISKFNGLSDEAVVVMEDEAKNS